jgi:tungstate transport system permease protein
MIWQGFQKAIQLILTGNPEVLRILWLSIKVSGTAVLISMVLGILIGTFLALKRFYGRNLVISLINTSMGLPPVVVGLAVVLLLWRSGPLGNLNLVYTPTAMIIAQVVISLPIVAGITVAAIQHLDQRYKLEALGLGASTTQLILVLWRESRLPLLAAVMAGFGGVISEVGSAIIAGGNIKGQTRVLTTAIVLETRVGRFSMAIALGIILLGLSFTVNLILTNLQQRT